MTQIEYLDYLCYWGKTDKSTKNIICNYHLLAYHCLDVAACGKHIIKNNIFNSCNILKECNISGTNAENWIIWFLASHDIGKFARGFQKYAEFPDSPLVSPISGVSAFERHDSLGFYLWGKLFEAWSSGSNEIIAGIEPENRARFESALNSWMLISTGHHGIPPDTMKNRSSLAFTDEDIVAATHYLEALSELFPFTLPQEWKTKAGRKCLKQHSWFFAGLVTLADWMGSDESQFPLLSSAMPLKDYWPLACEKAQQAILRMPPLSQHSHYQDHRALFPFIQTLTPLQQRASELDISAPGAQLVVLEDVTGAGKTEAALILTHRLMSDPS